MRILAGEQNEKQAKTVRTELRRWLRMAFSFPAMLTLLLATLVFTMASQGMGEPDIWWHLRNAEYLIQFHQLPRHDMYSFTVAGQSWINHEWLAEIPYYLAWRLWGLRGIQTLML